MFIAMNRFQIRPGKEEEFERIWRERDTHLSEVPGFKEFQLLRGPDREEYTLYASHTIWASEEAFEAWTKSDAFRMAHKGAGNHGDVYMGHPQFEGFQSVLETKLETA